MNTMVRDLNRDELAAVSGGGHALCKAIPNKLGSKICNAVTDGAIYEAAITTVEVVADAVGSAAEAATEPAVRALDQHIQQITSDNVRAGLSGSGGGFASTGASSSTGTVSYSSGSSGEDRIAEVTVEALN